MNEVLLKRMGARFENQIAEACAQGKGRELLASFFKEVAELKASSVFLRIETDGPKLAEEYSEEELAKIIDDYVLNRGLDLVKNVGDTLKSYGASEEEVADFVSQTAEAFQKKLDDLLEKSSSGGAA